MCNNILGDLQLGHFQNSLCKSIWIINFPKKIILVWALFEKALFWIFIVKI
jgi:hypothetical protein